MNSDLFNLNNVKDSMKDARQVAWDHFNKTYLPPEGQLDEVARTFLKITFEQAYMEGCQFISTYMANAIMKDHLAILTGKPLEPLFPGDPTAEQKLKTPPITPSKEDLSRN